ncbi:hypothetical protein NESM_000493400 [Novymonas esmeraldas]|uniref:Uncharacterized protein n=1 Tax=Novymonas esmeraldas TaxID=1808958 RepID=A0AAW0ER04_9TRYP
MSWFRSSAPPAAAPAASPDAEKPEQQQQQQHQQQQQQQSKTKVPPTRLSEAEQLDLLVAGAPLEDAEAQDAARFVRSNSRHTYADVVLGCAVYTFSGLQHVHGQSTALTLLTMWTVGTAFLVDVAERKLLQESLLLAVGQRTPTAPAAGAVASAPTTAPTAAPAARETLATQRRNVFTTQAVASWVWMLASLQQFKVHKRLKWCGYSSWMGLGCAGYYSTRVAYNLLVG